VHRDYASTLCRCEFHCSRSASAEPDGLWQTSSAEPDCGKLHQQNLTACGKLHQQSLTACGKLHQQNLTACGKLPGSEASMCEQTAFNLLQTFSLTTDDRATQAATSALITLLDLLFKEVQSNPVATRFA